MFTGLIEEIGVAESVNTLSGARKFRIGAKRIMEDLKEDDSVAVNGVCLTVFGVKNGSFEATAVEETLRRTTLTDLRPGNRLNLERALKVGSRLGGHWVQGHVDGIGRLVSRKNQGTGLLLTVEIPEKLAPFVVEKGSIAIHGVSLTVAEIRKTRVSVAVIPHTLEKTVLSDLPPGSAVNIETDLLAKYLYKWKARPDNSHLVFPE
ncbi:MAG TPA: riboflavin synthase [bacterium]|nr:riboflavin synthase [bacterium]